MGHGITCLKITTDPVELWAAPNSRSRIEREFFDSNFEPFYRIEQVCSCKTISNLSIVLLSLLKRAWLLYSTNIDYNQGQLTKFHV